MNHRIFSRMLILIFSMEILSSCASLKESPESPPEMTPSNSSREIHKTGQKNINSPSDGETKALEAQAQELKDETTIGREMAAKLCGTFGVWENHESTLKYVNLLGNSIAQTVGRPEITYRFEILEEVEVNAFATPGGYVFITQGLLKFVKNEHELAGVLAHEIAHVNHKHMYKNVAPKREVSNTEKLMKILSRGKSDMAQAFSQAIKAGMKKLLTDGLNPENEFEADASAVTYLTQVGYNPKPYLEMLERFGQAHVESHATKTHPPFAKRVAALQKFMAQNGFESYKPMTHEEFLKNRFEKSVGSL